MPSLLDTSVALILHLCSLDFSNILTKTAIERLADADEYEAVREVQVNLFYGMPSSGFQLTFLGILR
jgi:hypothetical protein